MTQVRLTSIKTFLNKEIAGFAVSIGATSVLLPMQKTLELQY